MSRRNVGGSSTGDGRESEEGRLGARLPQVPDGGESSEEGAGHPADVEAEVAFLPGWWGEAMAAVGWRFIAGVGGIEEVLEFFALAVDAVAFEGAYSPVEQDDQDDGGA